jgi:lysozyme family protein
MKHFREALKFVLNHEGGYSNNENGRDGGGTNFGITNTVYKAHTKNISSDVKNITQKEVEDIYFERYWIDGHCDDIPGIEAVAHFDACVNCGVGQAIKFLQKAGGVEEDGIYGHKTDKAIKEGRNILSKMITNRESFYIDLAKKKPYIKYLNGWLKRCDDLKKFLVTG